MSWTDWKLVEGEGMDFEEILYASRVGLEDQFSAEETFSTLMGTDVEARRTFIQQNAKDVRFLDF